MLSTIPQTTTRVIRAPSSSHYSHHLGAPTAYNMSSEAALSSPRAPPWSLEWHWDSNTSRPCIRPRSSSRDDIQSLDPRLASQIFGDGHSSPIDPLSPLEEHTLSNSTPSDKLTMPEQWDALSECLDRIITVGKELEDGTYGRSAAAKGSRSRKTRKPLPNKEILQAQVHRLLDSMQALSWKLDAVTQGNWRRWQAQYKQPVDIEDPSWRSKGWTMKAEEVYRGIRASVLDASLRTAQKPSESTVDGEDRFHELPAIAKLFSLADDLENLRYLEGQARASKEIEAKLMKKSKGEDSTSTAPNGERAAARPGDFTWPDPGDNLWDEKWNIEVETMGNHHRPLARMMTQTYPKAEWMEDADTTRLGAVKAYNNSTLIPLKTWLKQLNRGFGSCRELAEYLGKYEKILQESELATAKKVSCEYSKECEQLISRPAQFDRTLGTCKRLSEQTVRLLAFGTERKRIFDDLWSRLEEDYGHSRELLKKKNMEGKSQSDPNSLQDIRDAVVETWAKLNDPEPHIKTRRARQELMDYMTMGSEIAGAGLEELSDSEDDEVNPTRFQQELSLKHDVTVFENELKSWTTVRATEHNGLKQQLEALGLDRLDCRPGELLDQLFALSASTNDVSEASTGIPEFTHPKDTPTVKAEEPGFKLSFDDYASDNIMPEEDQWTNVSGKHRNGSTKAHAKKWSTAPKAESNQPITNGTERTIPAIPYRAPRVAAPTVGKTVSYGLDANSPTSPHSQRDYDETASLWGEDSQITAVESPTQTVPGWTDLTLVKSGDEDPPQLQQTAAAILRTLVDLNHVDQETVDLAQQTWKMRQWELRGSGSRPFATDAVYANLKRLREKS